MADEPDMSHAAVVTGYQPTASATQDGGEYVVITGSGFLGVNSVGFGTYSAPWFEVASDSEIHATAPAISPAVTNPSAAIISVWKDSLASDTTGLPEWTWAGQTAPDIAQANAAAG